MPSSSLVSERKKGEKWLKSEINGWIAGLGTLAVLAMANVLSVALMEPHAPSIRELEVADLRRL